jgi:hypothetical protein
VLPLAVLLALPWLTSAHARVAHVYRFAVPGVIDLSRAEAAGNAATRRDVTREALEAGTADAITQRPDCGTDGPWQLAPLDGDVRQARVFERQLLGSVGNIVRRTGGHLSITPARGSPIVFDDWSQATTRSREGDSETFVYTGTLSGSHYHRVEVRYGHDAPGSFLVNPATGMTAYAHNGSHAVAVAPGGTRLAVFDTLNAPYPLVVAALDAPGPAIEVRCRIDAGGARVVGEFCGWQDAAVFALRFTAAPGTPGAAAVAVARLARTERRWRLFAAERIDTGVHMQCSEFTR